MNPSQSPTARLSATRTCRTAGRDPETELILDRYRLHRRLGAGGFGTVWMARDERLERDVAIKILPRERVVGGRFEREARAAARLSHPGIVTLYEAAVDDDGAYLVSELVRGRTLDHLLDEGRLSDRDVARIAIVLCDALAHAHAQGIVHRDVKPSNVLVPEQPASPSQLAKLTDFGVARVIGGKPLTMTGDVVGTAAYMAPEQAEGLEAGAAADLYSLALVTYEALTGVNPVRTGPAAQRARRLGAYLPPLRRQRRDLPQPLGRAIDQALRPRPRERGDLEELRAVLAAAIPALEDMPGVVTSPWPVRTREPEPHPKEPWTRDPDSDAPPEHSEEIRAHPLGWHSRALAAGCAAALVWWCGAEAVSSSPVAPVAAALVAAVLVAALPRIGWLTATGYLVLAAAAGPRPGAAVLIGVGALAPLVLMPRDGAAWGLPMGAPALAVLGLGGGWPALAGRVGGPWRRAAVGAVGWCWLVLGSPLAGRGLYVNVTPAAHDWGASLQQTATTALRPILSSGVLAGAPVWALGALTLPWLVRGRSIRHDVPLAIVWAAVVVAGTGTAIAMVHPGGSLVSSSAALIGAIAAALFAIAPSFAASARIGRVRARFP